MIELFKAIVDIQTPFNMIVLVTMFGCALAAIAAVASEIRKYFCHRQEITFKQDLVDRGLPVDEIERIIAAQNPSDSDKPNTVHCQQYFAGED